MSDAMTVENAWSVLRGTEGHRCPWWLGWALILPLRRLLESPEKLLRTLVQPGSQVLEVGPGMGFFTTYLAERVGSEGRVHCVDVEARMLRTLGNRLARRGLDGHVALRQCGPTSLEIDDLNGTIDCAVLLHVLHELPEPRATLSEIAAALKPEGRLLVLEPPGHVSRSKFDAELALARDVGLVPVESSSSPRGRRLMAVLARVVA